MKNIFFFSFLTILLFSQCTPKTADKVISKSEVSTNPPEVVPNFRSTAPPAGPAPRIQMGSYEQFQLDNGLQVIVVENHKLPRVSYQLFIDVPPLNEGDESGTIQLAGDLLNKGTKNRSKSEIDESVDYIGASLSSNSNGLFAASLKKHNKELLEIMSDVLLNPSFPSAEFDKLKKQYASGLASGKDDPSELSSNLSNLVVYGKDHPYGEFMTEASLEKIAIDDVKAYYNTWFKPNIAYLIIVGDITKAEAEPLAKQYFSGWKANKNLMGKTPVSPKAPDGNVVSFINKTGAVQSVINVSYPIDLEPGSDDAIKARVMNTLLGAGVYFGNRLNQNLREDHAYTYGARSSLSSDKHVGTFAAGASVRNEVTDSSIVEILNEFNTIRNNKVDAAELQKVKNVLNGAFGRSLESPETIARFALNTARYNLPKDYYATYLEKLSKVSADDLMAMAKKYIKPENAHIMVVGNEDEVAPKLNRFAKSGKVNFYNNNFEKIDAPKRSIPAGVTGETVVEAYLTAIGGKDKLSKVKSVESKLAADFGGMTLSVDVYQQSPNKYASFTALNGNVMETEILNENKGFKSGQAGPINVVGEDLEEMKEKANPFQEMDYSKKAYTLKLMGIENINGSDAYKVKVQSPSGAKTTDFYDMATGYKVRSVVTQEAGGQTVTQIIEIGDYKSVEGVHYPHQLSISGGGLPMPLVMKAKSVKINGTIDPSVFTIK